MTMRRFLRDNALTLFFLALMVAALAGQALSGHAQFNQQQLAQGGYPVSLSAYLASSDYAVDVAENWQSEYLQFFLYISVTVWLIQRGSSESKIREHIGTESDEQQKTGRYAEADSPKWAHVGGLRG